ncbi:dolichyl-phosphate-mannose-protein mannosyltransferase [Singulisphaera sp. PoT]|uniref:dolichyl-phosphate-mannose-protein mannosyltransferase n=1 Tax=Singulisphaera sp. PoT TaxID=3411797 RepID=UPI003BF579BD
MKTIKTFDERFREPGSWWIALGFVVLLGIVLRIAIVSGDIGKLEDPDNYLKLARSLFDGRGFSLKGRPTAYRPPLYPIVLAPLVGGLGTHLPLGIATLHVLIGGATIVATGWTGRRWRMSHHASLAAAFVVAADPVLVSQARMVMTETFAAFLVVATLLVSTLPGLRGAMFGGMGFGLASLCRPSLLPAAFLAAFASVMLGPGSRRTRLGRGAILAVVTLATLSPWAWRNARIFGEPVWTTTHGGYTLALANNPVYYDDVLNGPPGTVWSGPNQRDWFVKTNQFVAGLGEIEADRRLRGAALAMIKDRPVDFCRASMSRLSRFWAIAPAGAVYSSKLRWITTLWTLPLWIFLIRGTLRKESWSWPQIMAAIFILTLTGVHLFYWTDLRMRAPIVPAIALVAALGLPQNRKASSDKLG